MDKMKKFIKKKKSEILTVIFLFLMFILAITSLRNETITNDEVVHLPAGYSYITKFDYRMNPEHPPLLKAFAALPLLFTKINFPQTEAWQSADQWTWGYQFLFQSGNNADLLIFLGKIPPILILMLLGWYLFLWAKTLYNEKIAVFVVGLYSFCPIFLAHGRFVTTDVAIATFTFITLYYFWLFLKSKDSSFKNNKLFWKFAVAFALTFLVKFSAPAVIIMLLGVALLYILSFETKKEKIEALRKTFLAIFWGGVFSIAAITVVYLIFTFKLLPEVARNFIDREIQFGFLIIPKRFFVPFLKWAVGIPILKGLAWYFVGMAMVFAHAAGGHTTYFLGEIGNGWRYYFPVIFNLKSTLPTLIVFYTIFAYLLGKFYRYLKDIIWMKANLAKFIKENFDIFYLFLPIVIYFILGTTTKLNLGVRYLLPIYPFIYLLSGYAVYLLANLLKKKIKLAYLDFLIMIGLLLWQFLSAISVYPYFLPFYNGFAGGADNGYKYAVDSNLDWGQDLKRLKIYMDEHNINKIYLSYFGKASPEYYGINYEPLLPDMEGKIKGFVAISATNLQGAYKEFNSKSVKEPAFEWLKKYPLVGKVGYSIFIYNIR